MRRGRVTRLTRLGPCLAFGLMSVACGGGDDGGGDSCGPFEACGGELTGAWSLQSVCYDADFASNVVARIGLPDECSDLIQSVQAFPEGTLTFGQDGTGMLDATVAVDMEFLYTRSCLGALGASPGSEAQICSQLQTTFSDDPQFDSVACAVSGTSCGCAISGAPTPLMSSGAFTIAGNALVDGSGADDPFCVQGDELSIKTITAQGNARLTLLRTP